MIMYLIFYLLVEKERNEIIEQRNKLELIKREKQRNKINNLINKQKINQEK